jgi:hypothetical protein
MTTSERKLYAREVAAYNDAEIDRFLVEIRDSGVLCVDIEDPENLPQLFYYAVVELKFMMICNKSTMSPHLR